MYTFTYNVDGGHSGTSLATGCHVFGSDLLQIPPAEPRPPGLEELLQPPAGALGAQRLAALGHSQTYVRDTMCAAQRSG